MLSLARVTIVTLQQQKPFRLILSKSVPGIELTLISRNNHP